MDLEFEEIKITINGQTYMRLEDVPAEFREQVRESLEKVRRDKGATRHSFVFNGIEYKSLDDMPPDVRRIFEDRDGNGAPSLVLRTTPWPSVRALHGAHASVCIVGDERPQNLEDVPSWARKLVEFLMDDDSAKVMPLNPEDQAGWYAATEPVLIVHGKVYRRVADVPTEYQSFLQVKGAPAPLEPVLETDVRFGAHNGESPLRLFILAGLCILIATAIAMWLLR